MQTDEATIDAPAEDAIYFLSPALIDPDPEQPRVHVDADLSASIAEQGVHQPITVRPHPTDPDRYMVIDGARRLAGSIAAKAKEIPARLRFDLEDKLDRLIVQVSTASGKPLSPLEQAKAFRQMLDADPALTHAKLADRLGIPKSTIGDRIRLLDIHPEWLKLIEDGRLQLSHAPAIHRFRTVPEKFQPLVVERMLSKGTGYGLGHDIAKGEPIRIDTFESKLADCYRVFLRPLADVKGYEGPVVEVKDSWHGPRKYAADPDAWKPIRNAQIKRAKEKRAKEGGNAGASDMRGPTRTLQRVDIDRLASAGIPVRETKEFSPSPAKGEVQIYATSGWAAGIDPTVLLASLDKSKLLIRKSTDKYSGSAIVVTTDAGAVEKARAAYIDTLKAAAKDACAKVRAKLTDDVVAANQVRGPGCVMFTGELHENAMTVLALAFDLDADVTVEAWGRAAVAIRDNAVAERVLSLFAAAASLKLDVPQMVSIKNTTVAKRQSIRFELPEPKSKKAQKREARARGVQVGDPSRASTQPAPSDGLSDAAIAASEAEAEG